MPYALCDGDRPDEPNEPNEPDKPDEGGKKCRELTQI
jgi:hypothetical protein